MITGNAPKDYTCPICAGIKDTSSPDTFITDTDFVYNDDLVAAIINTFFMGNNNSGNVIVIPKSHYESIYTLPDEVGHRIFEVSRKIAIAMKEAYKCDGIKIIQNNEPAADQHAFHYHLHLFPRYENDAFNSLLPDQKRLAEPAERAKYAERIKSVI